MSKIHCSMGKAKGRENDLSSISPIVSPSIATYFDPIQDIDVHEVEYIAEKILHPTNSDALLSVWSDLE